MNPLTLFRSFLSVSLIAVTFTLQAQQEEIPYLNYFYPQIGNAYILVDNANIRETPDLKAKAVAMLPIGSRVEILDQVDENTPRGTANGAELPFLRINYTHNGTLQTGYVWAGLVTTLIFPLEPIEGQVYFLAGLASVKNDKQGEPRPTFQIRAIKDGKEINKIEFTPNTALGLQTLSLKGEYMYCMDKVEHSLILSNLAEACGVNGGDNLIFWDGAKLYFVYEAGNIADAGVFSSNETIILPTNGGICGHVIVSSDDLTFDMEEESMPVKTQEYNLTLYKWTGKELKKVKNITNKK